MRHELNKSLFFLACLLLIACTEKSSAPTNIPELKLLPPTEIVDEVLLRETVIFESGGERQQLIAVSRIEFGRVRLVLLLPTGQTVLELDFNGNELLQKDNSGQDFPARYILAGIIFL